MASRQAIFSVLLSFLCLFHGCVSQQYGEQSQQGQCQFQRMNPLEPSQEIRAEGGLTQFWNHRDQQFQCAGVSLIRHVIQPKGFMLPSYTNVPLLVYTERGRGFFGLMIPGCPETFQSSQSEFGGQQQQQGQRGQQGQQQGQGGQSQSQRFHDRHQRIHNFGQGDILAIPAAAAHWVYNHGDEELVLIVLEDTTNNINQLDTNPRRFFLAGNLPRGQQQQQGQGQQQQGWGNIFKGFDVETLAEAFKVNPETARQLQSENDERGHIIQIREGLQVLRPPIRQEQQQEQQQQYGGQQQDSNGQEETVCTARFRENIDNPSRADIYSPRAGRFTTVNSFTFPILKFFQLSAEKGVLHRNAIFAPHWYVNANGIIYGVRGEARIQIVNHRGQTVFDEQLRQGQVVVVPQNFAVVKQAGNQGFEWVGFNTNDNAMINSIVGRTSTFRGLPVSVLANSLQISEEQALQLKYNRDETLILSPGSSDFTPEITMVSIISQLLFILVCSLSSSQAAVLQHQKLRRPGFVYTRARGKCTPQYWSSRTESWPKMVPQMSTVSNVFGSRAFERYRFDLTLLEATSRNDDDSGNVFAGLVKESTAALLNSYARKGYPYSAWEIKTMVIQALVSKEAASIQAQRFREANLACNQLHL
ncbi:OLC1v1007036C1 [Oldenlandia corymbosa var. corymbosa]|uniref:OLC1v1007036C1 n=1 Tax=Oldenlandia corymbosa var. corymbosa TaxID=529605 RepID=A0AAV1DID9_OLDCO|nr:OLC1v1007036C1 [Oldenlandia corymbosa var. corymbosa]